MERNITQNMDKSVIAKFIAELNQHQEHHIGYCGKDALEIEQALVELALHESAHPIFHAVAP